MLSNMLSTLLYCLTLLLVATAFPAAENRLSYERRAACNADNCLRALRGRSVTASAACSAFFGTEPPTVISATSYTTLPPTSTTYIIYTSPSAAKREELEPRQTTATAAASIPTYASACSGSVRFSSACSCLGISTPAPGPTTTIFESTETVTPPTLVATSTVCSPSNGYGYDVDIIAFYGTQYAQDFEIAMYANVSDPYGCCVTCYQTPECFVYYINSGVCNVQYGTGPTDPNGSAQCPLGLVVVNELVFFPEPGQGSGLGPCVPREVDAPMGGD